MINKFLIVLAIFFLSSSAWAQDEIVLGCSVPMTGPVARQGKQLIPGMLCYFNYINEQGGVNGKKIELVVLDDQYDIDKTVLNTQKFIEEIKPIALVGYVGTTGIIKVSNMLRKARLPLIGPISGAHQMHIPFNPYIFNIRNSYWAEAEVQVDYAVNELKIERIAVFYQKDEFGISGYKGVVRALALKYDKSIVSEAVFERGQLADDEAIERICKSNPDVIITVAAYNVMADFVKRVRARGINPLFIGNSFTRATPLAELLGKLGNGVIITQASPPPPTWSGADFPAVELYRKLMRTYYPGQRFTAIAMGGFIVAKVVVEGLRRCGDNLTSENLVNALETFKDYNLDIDATITYAPRFREGFDAVYLTEIRNEKPNYLVKTVRKTISMYIF